MKSILGALLRWGIAIGLIVWVVRSGKLSLSDLAWFKNHPLRAGLFYSFEFSLATISIVRWWTLLRALDFNISLGTSIRLGMLGNFFSTVLPGTVSGDVVKGVYVARRYPKKKARVVMTLLVDRLCGLAAVIFLGTIGFLFGYSKLQTFEGATVDLIKSFGALIAGVGVVTFVALLLFPVFAKKLPRHLPKKIMSLPKSQVLQQVYDGIVDYRDKPFAIWSAVGISMIIQVSNMYLLWLLAGTIFGPAPWGSLEPATFVLAAILGICAMQIPLAPMGLGLGQMVFAPIFVALGAPSPTFGAALITSLQLFQIFVNLVGMVFFATYRHQVEETLDLGEAAISGAR